MQCCSVSWRCTRAPRRAGPAGVVAVGFGGLVVLRRRNATSLDEEADEEEGESPFSDAEDEEEKAQEEDANPFAELAATGSGFGADVGQATKRPLRSTCSTVSFRTARAPFCRTPAPETSSVC